jgi:hypothetical protein
MKKINGYNTGVASEYYILSLLYRQGYEAYITSGNKKSVDIRVAHEERTLSIDVKAVQGYSSLIVNNVAVKDNHFVVFVIYNNKFDDVLTIPDLYILPSKEVIAQSKSFGDQKRVFKGAIAQYKDNWKIIHEYLYT